MNSNDISHGAPDTLTTEEAADLANIEDALVQRLRARRNFWSTDRLRWYMNETPDADCKAAADEIERLRGVARDLLWSFSAQPSCQAGIVIRCMCTNCATARARDAVPALAATPTERAP